MTDTALYIEAMTNWQRKQWHAMGRPSDEARLVAILARQRRGAPLPVAEVKAAIQAREDAAVKRRIETAQAERIRERGKSWLRLPVPTDDRRTLGAKRGTFDRAWINELAPFPLNPENRPTSEIFAQLAAAIRGPKIMRRGVR